ncbi:MAG: DUF1987 domain-containing protein [Bacteroidia bacterium]|nr:DUF1987 domain-containing protein [Bacteroidia bacterium]
MKQLIISGTKVTPLIRFDHIQGILDIKGISVPGDAIDFYMPVMNWLSEYISSPVKVTTVNIKLDYYNTNSSKCLLEILRKLEKLYLLGNEVFINWYYETEYEDLKEAGEDFCALLKLPINIISL